jgi:thiol-disulfide isomerase/thioredoxin
MINPKKLKNRIIQTSILTAVLLTNTGCFFGYFENPLVPVEKPLQNRTFSQTNSAPVKVVFSSPTPNIECTNESSSHCNKPPIQADELKPKIQTSTGGEVHKLRSIQGKNITVVERSNGFIFPQYKNKVIILEMFGKKCPHCIKGITSLNKLRSKYRGKVEIIAVQVEDKMSSSEAKSLIRRHKIHYPLIPGDTATNLQYNIQNTYGWTGILPFTMVIKNGVTEFTYPGTVSYNELNKDIRSIVN